MNIVRDTPLSFLYRQKELVVRTALKEEEDFPIIFAVIIGCGLFDRCPSTQHKSDPARFDVSSELSFFIVILATLLFYLNLATTNLALAVDTETGTNVYISFPFEVHRNLK